MKRDLMLHAQWAAAPVRAASGALLYLLLVAGQALARASEPIRRKCRNRSPGGFGPRDSNFSGGRVWCRGLESIPFMKLTASVHQRAV